MLRCFIFSRSSLNRSVLSNAPCGVISRKQFKHDAPKTILEPDDSFELGDFTSDLKSYLKNKNKKSFNFSEKTGKKDEIPIIICKNSKLNHYRNQTYEKFKPMPLASENWRSHKSIGDYFKIKIYSKDYDIQNRKENVPFEQSDLDARIIDILKTRNIKDMSEIQQLALPSILTGKNHLLGAETGCGKTLAYLLPIITQVLNWKAKAAQPSFNAPYVLILVPSRELSDQVKTFCKWFEELGIKTRRLVGGNVSQKVHNPSFDEIDILVSTPGVIQKLTNADIYSLKNVKHVVLDEADCLLDDSFNDLMTEFLGKINFRSMPSADQEIGVQMTLVSATLPTSVEDILEGIIDVEQLETITTEKLHYIMPHVTHKFIRTGRTSRPSFFLDIAKKDFRKKAPSIIFCNHSETCTWLSTFLEDNNIPNIMLHGDISLRSRLGRFDDFQKGVVNTLVCTSLAARGLDTCRVEHVINFEFPSFMAEYVHRCGRTGRLGSEKSGTVTNLISGRNEVPMVQKIELAVRTMSKFENVNPNIKRIVKYHHASDIEKKLGLLS